MRPVVESPGQDGSLGPLAAPSPGVPPAGNLAVHTAAEVLGSLLAQRATGVLLLRREKVKKIAYVQDGVPSQVKSNLLSECLGRVMVRERLISEAVCEQSIQRMEETRRQQGAVLLEMGAVTRDGLEQALNLQFEAKLLDVFSWPDGDYQFNARQDLPPVAGLEQARALRLLVLGTRRHVAPARVEQRLAGLLDACPRCVAADAAQLEPEDAQLVRRMDGTRSLRELAASGGTGRVATLAYSLLVCGGLETAAPAPPPLPRASQPPPPPLPKVETAAPPKAAAPPPEDAARVALLAARVRDLRRMNAFEILGVARGASPEEVKKAYLGLAKDFHPDRPGGPRAGEAKMLADQVYGLLSQAFETLSDPRERGEHLARHRPDNRPGVAGEAARALAAHAWLERAQAAMGREDWREARELLKRAVAAHPKDGVLEGLLAWCHASAANGDERAYPKATALALEATQHAPRHPDPWLAAGRVDRAAGRPADATRHLEQALALHPEHPDALRELAVRTPSAGRHG